MLQRSIKLQTLQLKPFHNVYKQVVFFNISLQRYSSFQLCQKLYTVYVNHKSLIQMRVAKLIFVLFALTVKIKGVFRELYHCFGNF